MGALNDAKSIEYVSDNPRLIGGLTYAAVNSDICDTVDIYPDDKAKKFLLFTLLAATREYAKKYGHEEATKELHFLLMTVDVIEDSEQGSDVL